jgi:hypothetical protein
MMWKENIKKENGNRKEGRGEEKDESKESKITEMMNIGKMLLVLCTSIHMKGKMKLVSVLY